MRAIHQITRVSGTNRLFTSIAATSIPVLSSPRLFNHQYEGSNSNQQKLSFLRMFAFSAGAIAVMVVTDQMISARACGIVGYIGEQPATPMLLEGITILQNRGYDSAGIATIREQADEPQLVVTKFASKGSTSDCVDLLAQRAPEQHLSDRIGIAHTRWATHGGKTDENAHPHTDMSGRFALVHNGTIENSAALRHELETSGVQFTSQTDTEVIVQLLGQYASKMPMLQALRAALRRCEGTYGIVCIDRTQPRQLVAVGFYSSLSPAKIV